MQKKRKGETYKPKQIKFVPSRFEKWIEDNKDRIDRAKSRGTLPYWLRDNANFGGIKLKDKVENNSVFRYTPEELARVKQEARSTLDFGRETIIGKYEFEHEAFSGKLAKFTRNSFLENLRYGEAFEDKVEMLRSIDRLLKNVTYDRFDSNAMPTQKPSVSGYYVFNGVFKNNTVEYMFEKRKDGSIIFHFIKLHKQEVK